MENDNFTPEQSLHLINKMIADVKNDLHDNGFFFLFWGWLVFVSAMAHFIMIKMNIPYSSYIWIILMPLGGIISAAYGIIRRKKEKKRAKSFINRAMAYVWIAFGVALFIVLSSGSVIGFEKVYPFVLLVYGIGTFITGGIIRMKLLVAGGIVCWILSIVAFYVTFDIQLLLLAAAIAIAYIIPGHVINSNYKRNV